MTYYVGSLTRLTVVFTSVVTSLPADPTTVALVVMAPDGTTVIYAYPSPIVKDDIGSYHYDLSLTQVGNWQYEWQGTGAVTAVSAGILSVSPFPTVTWSYSGNPASSPKDEVRFLIGDTNTNDQQLQDAEINYAISLVTPPASPNYIPAIYCAEALAAKYARMVTKSVGDLHVSYTDRLKNFQALATQLRTRATLAMVPFNVGGELLSEKVAAFANGDLITTAARINGMSEPGTAGNEYPAGQNQTTLP